MLYLLKSPTFDSERILYKVGFSDDFDRRLQSYQSSNPEIELITTKEGDELDEYLSHKFLHRLKNIEFVKNEWYKVLFKDERLQEFFKTDSGVLRKYMWNNKEDLIDCLDASHWSQLAEALGIQDDPLTIQFLKFFEKPKEDKITIFRSSLDDDLKGILWDFPVNSAFEVRLKEYCRLRDENLAFIGVSIKLSNLFPKLEQYYSFLGTAVCRAECYEEASIRRRISDIEKSDIISEEIYKEFSLGLKYPLKFIKEKLREIYKRLGVFKTPKASDILEYFNVSEKKVTDKITKKRVPCYQIISIK
jgi:hypothetical protein